METMLIVSFAAVIIAAVAVCGGVAATVRRRDRVVELDEELARKAARALVDQDPESIATSRPGPLTAILREAGFSWSATTFLLIVLVFSILLAIALQSFANAPAAGVAGFIAGPVLTMALVASKRKSRERAFDGQLAAVLPMIAENLRGGLSVEAAIKNVGKYMDDPLKSEFEQVSAEMSYGVPFLTALQNMEMRISCPDIPLVTAVVAINRDTGCNLADILETIASTISRRIKMRGHVAAVTANGRMQAIVVGILPPGVLLATWLTSPSYVEPLFTTTIGICVLVAVAVMELIGELIMYKMYNMRID